MANVLVTVPGDKSISHRAIILSAISEAVVRIDNLLFSDDVMSTVIAMQALGVSVSLDASTRTAIVRGVGLRGLQAPKNPIDCGNSGTTMRLLAGLLAGQRFDSVLIGDASLSLRPMARIAKPLRLMGASISLSETHTAPIKIRACSNLVGIDYKPDVASAQVKSCVLLAGLYAKGITTVSEPVKTRDHTERLFEWFQSDTFCSNTHDSQVGISNAMGKCGYIPIPGDMSSATFFIVLALLTPGAHLTLKQVGINPRRTGAVNVLRLMGANITFENHARLGLEPVADIHVIFSQLDGVEIPQEFVVSAIDEFPIIFIAAALAKGKTTLRGAKELRVKEADRITVMANGLSALGVSVKIFDDGLEIESVSQLKSGYIKTQGDHRVAMAFLIAAKLTDANIILDDHSSIKTSFPSFLSDLEVCCKQVS